MADPVNPSKTIIYTNKNWQKEWFRNVLYQKQYVGLNGGDQNLKYAASVGYLGDQGILPMNNYENLTMHGNTSFKVTKNLEASTTFDLSHGKIQPTTDNYFAAIGRGLMMSPTHIGRYPDGTFATGGTNKVQQSAEFYSAFYDRARITNQVMGSINLKWKVTDWLSANAQYSYFDNNYRGSYYAHGEVDGTPNYIEQTRSTTETRTGTTRNVFITYLTADKYFGKHHLQGTAGYDWSKWHYEYLTARNTGSLSDKIPYLTSGGDNTSGTMSMSNQRHDTALISYFARTQYSLRTGMSLQPHSGRMALLSSRRQQVGYFPSVSGAWLISEEPFFESMTEKMNMLSCVSPMARRATTAFQNRSVGGFQPRHLCRLQHHSPSTMQNKDLKWETTTQMDIGLDIASSMTESVWFWTTTTNVRTT